MGIQMKYSTVIQMRVRNAWNKIQYIKGTKIRQKRKKDVSNKNTCTVKNWGGKIGRGQVYKQEMEILYRGKTAIQM